MNHGQQPFWRRPIYATRVSAHLLFAVMVWPILTLLGSTVTLMNVPYFAVAETMAFKASLLGLVIGLPDMVVIGAVFFGISGALFGRFGPDTRAERYGFARLCVEPLLTFAAVVAGTSLFYPSVLSTPLLAPLSSMPALGAVLLLLGLVTAGALIAARPGNRLRLASALILLGVLSSGPSMMRSAFESVAGDPPDVIVLGLDSLSHHDDIAPLDRWTKSRGGVWYEHAVAPGLLTNAVWSSILTMQPVSAHHVFHTFERPAQPAAFLTAARARGYRTVSIFPDQLTASIGSRAGFDEDRSGPVGWRQILLPVVANSSFLVPVLKPALPRLWRGASPNQAGTFTYDVRRDIRSILRAGSRKQRTLVAAHLTYTHSPAYPRTFDLSLAELWNVARAPAGNIEDRSFDWQDTDRPADPIKLQAWKLAFLQRVIQSEVDSSGYLRDGRRLVLFSDHGHRLGLNMYSFKDERFHHVLLATFGVPARCPNAPISLIDIGALLHFSQTRADAAVEFAITPSGVWPTLMGTAQLRWAGDVELDAQLLAGVFSRLQRHQPWQDLDLRQCGHGPDVR